MLQLELWRPALLAVLLLGTVTAAAAQEATQASTQAATQELVNPAENAYASATPEDVAASSDDVAPKIVDRVPIEIDDATLSKALSSESSIFDSLKMKPLTRRDGSPNSAKWNRVDNPDGSANYSVNKPLAAPWDAKVGADISTAAPPPDSLEPRPLPGALPSNSGSASAWANLAVPHFAIIEVRAEPGLDYDKVGTRLERSVPLGKSFSVTAQTSLGVTEMRPSTASSATIPSADAATRLFSTDNSLQLNVLATGTSLAAGTSTTTGDPVTHNRFSAAQKVYGPLNVTGTVNDPGQSTSNMSLTAGMNLSW